MFLVFLHYDKNFFFFFSELIYCGNILKDDHQSLEQQGIKVGSTIHIFPKQIKEDSSEEPLTDDQIQRAVVHYRLLNIGGSSVAVSSSRFGIK